MRGIPQKWRWRGGGYKAGECRAIRAGDMSSPGTSCLAVMGALVIRLCPLSLAHCREPTTAPSPRIVMSMKIADFLAGWRGRRPPSGGIRISGAPAPRVKSHAASSSFAGDCDC